MGFCYTAFPPSPALRSMVDAYWINEDTSSAIDLPPAYNRILPDGCIDLIFRGGHGTDNGRSPHLFISPLIEEPELIVAPPRSWYVGVRFRPAMARLAIPLPPAECRNQALSATSVSGKFHVLEQELTECASPQAALPILRRYIDTQLPAFPEAGPPARVRRALTLLADFTAEPGNVASVAAALGTTQRSLHRDVVHWTGLAPKVLGRIFRMQAALRILRIGVDSLATIAANAGYADQAHMTRELRRLTGATPTEYWRPVRRG